MAIRKLTQERVDEIRDEYEKWSQWGSDESATVFAKRMGISKARLYDLRKRDWKLASTRKVVVEPSEQQSQPNTNNNMPAAEMVSFGTLNRLIDNLVACRTRLAEVEAENEHLRARLSEET